MCGIPHKLCNSSTVHGNALEVVIQFVRERYEVGKSVYSKFVDNLIPCHAFYINFQIT